MRPSWGERELVVAAMLDFIRNPDGQKLTCPSRSALLLCTPVLAFDLVVPPLDLHGALVCLPRARTGRDRGGVP